MLEQIMLLVGGMCSTVFKKAQGIYEHLAEILMLLLASSNRDESKIWSIWCFVGILGHRQVCNIIQHQNTLVSESFEVRIPVQVKVKPTQTLPNKGAGP